MVCREEYTGDFVPYQGTQTLSISTPNSLPGIPVDSGGNFTDADGQQRICNVVDMGTKIATQFVDVVTVDGSQDEVWAFNSASNGLAQYVCSGILKKTVGTIDRDTGNYLSTIGRGKQVGYGGQEGAWIFTTSISQLVVVVSEDEVGVDHSISTFRSWLSEHPVTVVYPISISTTIPLSEEELAAYRALTTYEGTTVISATEPVAGIEASYVMDGNKYKDSVDKRLSALEAAQTGV